VRIAAREPIGDKEPDKASCNCRNLDALLRRVSSVGCDCNAAKPVDARFDVYRDKDCV
jgi:hypothetical protein